MLLEDLTVNKVQIIRARVLELPLDSFSSNPILPILLRQEMSRVKVQSRAYHEPTPALNVKAIGM